jgi:hypothetical protein
VPLIRQSTFLSRTPNTSRRLPNPERSALAILRSLAPRRQLSLHDAAFIGELQAYRLLELARLGEAPVSSDLILDLPRLQIHHDLDLPVSGTTHWLNGRWIITVNASEPLARQRFTLAHELKHVIDHRHRDVLYGALPGIPIDLQTERAADNFAACLLMPKRWVKKAWGEGHQRIGDLSELFDVSPQAMRVRLQNLGLLGAAGRHEQRQDELQPPAYQRLSRRSGGLRT